MSSSEEPSSLRHQAILGAVEAGIAAGSAVIGELIGDPSGAVVAAALAPTITRAVKGFIDDRRKNLQKLVSEAFIDLSVEDIERAFSRPEYRLLFARSLEAAAHTANEAKITALARVLKSGFAGDDSTAVDAAMQVLETLAELEILHIRLLAIIEAAASVVEEDHAQGATRMAAITKQPSLEPVIDKVMADCSRLGLIYDNSKGRWNQGTWHERPMMLTDYGVRCLEKLREMEVVEP